MPWNVEGRYFENCSCEMPCPCTISLDAGADYDRCEVLLAFAVDSGEVDGVDVGGVNLAVIADSPKVMTDGNWKLGVVIDDSASDEQAQKIAAVFGGELGGPMGGLAPLIGENLGLERAPIDFSEEDGAHRVSVGDSTSVELHDVVPFGSESGKPARVVDVNHPVNSTLTVGRAGESSVSLLGLEFSNTGKAGFSGAFSWSG